MVRHKRIRALGVPDDIQVSEEAALALESLLREVVGCAVEQLSIENRLRDKWSKRLVRILPRHVETVRKRLEG